MNAVIKRIKAFGYVWWARCMRPIERHSPRTKDRIVKVLARGHVIVYRLRRPTEKTALAAPTLLLTVAGRKSRRVRTYPLFYTADGDRYLVVGSYGGDHRDPQWVHNATTAGEATVEVGSRTLTVTVELASPEERAQLWPRLLETWPSYDEYQEVAGDCRQLPVLILTPRSEEAKLPQQAQQAQQSQQSQQAEQAEQIRQAEYDAIIVGAGFAGVRTLWELRRQGLSVRVLEKGSGPGGTWYWNRYPGAHSDSPSWVYCFMFDDELLQDWDWPERFPGQPAIEQYFNHVIDRFDLRKDMQFGTTVSAATFDDESENWTVTTGGGETFRCKYLVSATGVLHAALEPPFPGADTFVGEVYSTSAWPKERVDFVGKRVGVIGTGASGVQVIQTVVGDAAELKVFQRTASFVLPARNHALDDFQRDSLKRTYDEIKQRVSEHPFSLPYELPRRTFVDTPPERRDGVFERGWELGDFHMIFSTYDDLLTNAEANAAAQEFVRRKIRSIVHDPETAELLCPKGHPIFSKRPPVGFNYYENFNRSHVTLVDIRANPIARITPRGIVLRDGTEHELDMIIYSLGFDAATGSLTRMNIRGRGGEPLREKWSQSPDNFLGITVDGFPNLFMLSGPGAQFSNFPVAIESQAEWIGKAIAHLRSNGYASMEPTAESVASWTALLEQIAGATLVPEGADVGSWIYGQNVPGKPRAAYFFLGGVPMYLQLINAEADGGFAGFAFAGARAEASVG